MKDDHGNALNKLWGKFWKIWNKALSTVEIFEGFSEKKMLRVFVWKKNIVPETYLSVSKSTDYPTSHHSSKYKKMRLINIIFYPGQSLLPSLTKSLKNVK